jgi:predicted O-methyltransferase YrrM
MVDKLHPHNPEEYRKLLEWVKGSESILEVGSRYGFTLYDLAKASNAKKVVGVDLPGDARQWGKPDSEQSFRDNVSRLKEEGVDAHCIVGDSHSPEVIDRVKSLGPFDFVFIDANHTYESVKKDWDNYGHLGSVVVFHDVVRHTQGNKALAEVWRLWEEIKKPKERFIAQGSPMGIGRVWNKS